MKTKLIVIGVLAAIAITGVWFVALWSPQGAKLDTAKAEQQAAEQKVDQLRTRLAHAKQLQTNAAVLEADRAKLAAALPDADLLDDFIRSVNEKAASSGVSFVSVAPTKPTTPSAGAAGAAATSGPVQIPLQIQVTGDYFAVMRFLESIRIDGERLVTVENLTMNKPTADGQPVTANIAGKMFVHRPAAAAGTTVTTAPVTQTAS